MRKFDLRLIRYSLALIWLWTAWVSALPSNHSVNVELLGALGLQGRHAQGTLLAGIGVDVTLGLATLLLQGKWLRRSLLLQLCVIVAYTAIITTFLPAYWLHPFGPILKNVAVLVLIHLLLQYDS